MFDYGRWCVVFLSPFVYIRVCADLRLQHIHRYISIFMHVCVWVCIFVILFLIFFLWANPWIQSQLMAHTIITNKIEHNIRIYSYGLVNRTRSQNHWDFQKRIDSINKDHRISIVRNCWTTLQAITLYTLFYSFISMVVAVIVVIPLKLRTREHTNTIFRFLQRIVEKINK